MKELAAKDILRPTIKSCEFFGIGPFEKTLSRKRKWVEKYRRYRVFISLLQRFWLARGVTIVVFKYLFARHLMGTAGTDITRALIATGCLHYLKKKLSPIQDAIDKFDTYPHAHATGLRLARFIRNMNRLLWTYVASRVVFDLITVWYENRLGFYIETELLVKPSSIPSTAYPAVYAFMALDFSLNRMFFTGGTTQSIFFYNFMTFMVGIKFNKFNDDLQHFGERTPFDAGKARKLRLRHADLSQLVIDLDKIFCPLGMVFHGGFVIGCCTESISSIQKIADLQTGKVSYLTIAGAVLNMTYLAINLSMTTVSTSMVSEASDLSIGPASGFLVDSQEESVPVSQQIRLLLSQMRVPNVLVTGGKFYTLNRSTMMTTLGAAFSYVSVVIDQSKTTRK